MAFSETANSVKVVDAPIRSVDFMMVNESAKQADSIYKKILLNCAAQEYVEKMSFAIYRNDKTDQTKQTAPQTISAPWQRRLAQFACGSLEQLTVANGFLNIGQITDNNIVDFTWNAAWKDGVRPPYTKTKEQVLTELQQNLQQYKKQLDDSRKTVNDIYLKGSASPADRLRADVAQTREDTIRSTEDTRRRSNVFNPVMETWIGATEEQLVGSWGRAQNYGVDTNGNRTLTYTYGYADQLRNGSGAILNEAPHYCNITWVLRNGVTTTYHWKYTSARSDCSSLTIGIGPYPQKQFK
jgi:hypothetical protein